MLLLGRSSLVFQRRGQRCVTRAPVQVQLPGSHTHKQAGPLQALPTFKAASAVPGRALHQVLQPANKRAVAAAANNSASCSGTGQEEVGKKKPAKQCQHPDCVKRASYGYPGERALYCRTHSLELKGMVDVIHKLCEHLGCNTRASFAKPGKRARFCSAHKLKNMVNVNSKPRSKSRSKPTSKSGSKPRKPEEVGEGGACGGRGHTTRHPVCTALHA